MKTLHLKALCGQQLVPTRITWRTMCSIMPQLNPFMMSSHYKSVWFLTNLKTAWISGIPCLSRKIKKSDIVGWFWRVLSYKCEWCAMYLVIGTTYILNINYLGNYVLNKQAVMQFPNFVKVYAFFPYFFLSGNINSDLKCTKM